MDENNFWEKTELFLVIGFLILVCSLFLISLFTDVEAHPQVQIISSTTYVPYENGQVIARFLDYKFDPISTNCTATVLYPNKTIFINQQMAFVSILDNFYANFIVPEIYGVYEYSVTCLVNNKNISG